MKEETLRPWHTYPCCAVPWHKDTPNWKLSYLLTYVNSSDILVAREKKSSSIYLTTDWNIVALRMLFPWLKTEHVILSFFHFSSTLFWLHCYKMQILCICQYIMQHDCKSHSFVHSQNQTNYNGEKRGWIMPIVIDYIYFILDATIIAIGRNWF